jgi:hypothetical protein
VVGIFVRGRIRDMPRFSIKAVLRGITAASIGFAMLAITFRGATPPASQDNSIGHAFLVAFGGALAGYGLAFPFSWPPHQMIFAMIGMFAAQSWQTGNVVGLVFFVGIMVLFSSVRAIASRKTKPEGQKNNSPSEQSKSP